MQTNSTSPANKKAKNGESANNGTFTPSARKSIKRSYIEGQQDEHYIFSTSKTKLRRMATREPAVFADAEKGSTHLIDEYKPVTKEEAASRVCLLVGWVM